MGTKCFIAVGVFFGRTRENDETERDIEGVGWDKSIPLKLYLGLDGNGSLFPPEVRMILFTVFLIREF